MPNHGWMEDFNKEENPFRLRQVRHQRPTTTYPIIGVVQTKK
jgi:hypothetical protein